MSTAIKVEGVSKKFGTKEVLRHVSLDIPRSSIFALIGPSGCGKTTLVKIIIGLLTPTTGSIDLPAVGGIGRKAAAHLGYMAQSAALYPLLSGRENLKFFGRLYGLKKQELTERITQVANLVHLTEDLDVPAQNYSGGMLQRLSLAIALLHDPKLLILDEPTVGIDPLLRQEIWKELRKRADNGTTILITTHVMDEAEKADQLAMMRRGEVLAVGHARELINRTRTTTFEEAFIHFASGEDN
ncbi:MAG: ABC transporter ATP-binding protein [Actinomycetaceae bacterium]|nr:ABC transporter ATP-binding protein [Actinomycetaceae bacterium]